MSILTAKRCAVCGHEFISVKHESVCRDCLVKPTEQRVLCVYCGMMLSFRVPADKMAGFAQILSDNGATHIEWAAAGGDGNAGD